MRRPERFSSYSAPAFSKLAGMPKAKGTIHVFTFKEGLMSAVAHDLRVNLPGFEISLDGSAVKADFDLKSLVVDGPMKDGVLQADQYDAGKKADVAKAMHGEVLHTEKNPKAALAEFRKEVWDLLQDTGVAMAEHDLGHERESQQALDRLVAKHAQEAAYQIAEVHAWRGEKDEAFEWLDRAFAQRDEGLIGLKVDRCLASLRDDPRYAALLAKVNLPHAS
jgi:hypothetical protein